MIQATKLVQILANYSFMNISKLIHSTSAWHVKWHVTQEHGIKFLFLTITNNKIRKCHFLLSIMFNSLRLNKLIKDREHEFKTLKFQIFVDLHKIKWLKISNLQGNHILSPVYRNVHKYICFDPFLRHYNPQDCIVFHFSITNYSK